MWGATRIVGDTYDGTVASACEHRPDETVVEKEMDLPSSRRAVPYACYGVCDGRNLKMEGATGAPILIDGAGCETDGRGYRQPF